MQEFLAGKGHSISQRMRDLHNIPGLFNLTICQTLDYIREFHRSPMMGQLLPEPCAAVVLPKLYSHGYRFVAITACLDEPEVQRAREDNLRSVFGFPFEAVHCVGLGFDKTALLKHYDRSIWVEDMPMHAVAGADLGHRTYLLHRLHNAGLNHPKVMRVRDWHDIAADLCPASFDRSESDAA
jgi:5'(3')-deoxyribonucleotidase